MKKMKIEIANSTKRLFMKKFYFVKKLFLVNSIIPEHEQGNNL